MCQQIKKENFWKLHILSHKPKKDMQKLRIVNKYDIAFDKVY